MIDIISYKLPFGIIGRCINYLFIKNKLNSIFNYRYEKMNEIFQGKDNDFSIAVCLNAAAGLIVGEKSNSLKEGYEKLRKHILSGKVVNHISNLS